MKRTNIGIVALGFLLTGLWCLCFSLSPAAADPLILLNDDFNPNGFTVNQKQNKIYTATVVPQTPGLIYLKITAKGQKLNLFIDGAISKNPHYWPGTTTFGTQKKNIVIPHQEAGPNNPLKIEIKGYGLVYQVVAYYFERQDTKLLDTHNHTATWADNKIKFYNFLKKILGVDYVMPAGDDDKPNEVVSELTYFEGLDFLRDNAIELKDDADWAHATYSGKNADKAHVPDSKENLKIMFRDAFKEKDGGLAWVNHPSSNEGDFYDKFANEPALAEAQNLPDGYKFGQEEGQGNDIKEIIKQWANRIVRFVAGADTEEGKGDDGYENNPAEATSVKLPAGFKPKSDSETAHHYARRLRWAILGSLQNGRQVYPAYGDVTVLSYYYNDILGRVDVEDTGQSKTEVKFKNEDCKTVKTVEKGPGRTLALIRFDESEQIAKAKFIYAEVWINYADKDKDIQGLKYLALVPPMYFKQDPNRGLDARDIESAQGVVGEAVATIGPMPDIWSKTNWQQHSFKLTADGQVTFNMGETVFDGPGYDFTVVASSSGYYAVYIGQNKLFIGYGYGIMSFDIGNLPLSPVQTVTIKNIDSKDILIGGVLRKRGTRVEGFGKSGVRTALVFADGAAKDPFKLDENGVLKCDAIGKRAWYVHGAALENYQAEVSLKFKGALSEEDFAGLVVGESTFPILEPDQSIDDASLRESVELRLIRAKDPAKPVLALVYVQDDKKKVLAEKTLLNFKLTDLHSLGLSMVTKSGITTLRAKLDGQDTFEVSGSDLPIQGRTGVVADLKKKDGNEVIYQDFKVRTAE